MNKYSYCYLSGNIKNIKNSSLAQRLIAVISIKTSLGQRTAVRPVLLLGITRRRYQLIWDKG